LQKLGQVSWNGINRFDETARADHCVKGAPISVYVLVQKMAASKTEAELLKAYPQLSNADLMTV